MESTIAFVASVFAVAVSLVAYKRQLDYETQAASMRSASWSIVPGPVAQQSASWSLVQNDPGTGRPPSITDLSRSASWS